MEPKADPNYFTLYIGNMRAHNNQPIWSIKSLSQV